MQEDIHLCAILEALGGPKKEPGFSWTEVARTLGGGRNGKSCRLRWCAARPLSLRPRPICLPPRPPVQPAALLLRNGR
jgi:hypothetical protein